MVTNETDPVQFQQFANHLRINESPGQRTSVFETWIDAQSDALRRSAGVLLTGHLRRFLLGALLPSLQQSRNIIKIKIIRSQKCSV